MPNFQYIALDSRGGERSGAIDAENEKEAVTRIRAKGLFPTEVSQAAASAKKRASAKARSSSGKKEKRGGMSREIKIPGLGGRVKPKQLMVATRQLSTLINAGLPLLRCLQVLQRQEKTPALHRAFAEIGESIQSGSTLAEGLAGHAKIFNRLYINMVKAGEVGGVLDVVLLRLADFMEKTQKIKSKVTSAMIYPIVVLMMAFAILTFLMVKIVPKFEQVFADLLEGEGLPALTQMVMNTSKAFTAHLHWIGIGIILMIALFKLLATTQKGGRLLDKFKLNLPIFGTLMRKSAIARFTRTLGTLMTSGVPVLQALTIVRDTAGNAVIAQAVTDIHDSVKEGENMAPPLDATGVFPPIVVSMVEVGEETGELPEMFMKIADTYDEEVDNAVAGLTSIIEPILIVLLAVVVGAIVIALFLPLVSIIGSLSG